MCGRFYIEESPEFEPIIAEMNRSPLTQALRARGEEPRCRGEIRPADTAAVLAPSRGGKRAVFPMKWGFSGKGLVINARSETAGERPLFRESWRAHRCAVPATGYIEWEHLLRGGKKRTGDAFRIRPREQDLTWLCGLYRMEEGFPHFVILTREAEEEIRFIHDRMPLMMPRALLDEWLRPDGCPEALLSRAVREMRFETLKTNTEKLQGVCV